MLTMVHVPADAAGRFVISPKTTNAGGHHGWLVVSGTEFGGARTHCEIQGGEKALRLARAICDRLNARTGKHAFANTKIVRPQPQDYVAAGLQHG